MTIILITLIAAIMMGQTDEQNNRQTIVRPATQAGRFYDGNAQRLSREVDSLLAMHQTTEKAQVAALIVPHAGYYFSGSVAAAAYATLHPDKPYKRIFMLGPSHHEWLDGASVNTEADCYATPLGQVRVDRETCRKLIEADSVFAYRPEAHDREHCLEVQLPFLQRRLGDVPPIVPVIISTNDFSKLERMAEVLKPYINDQDNLFVISSDFSHYPSYDDACKVDALTGKAVESGDVSQLIAAIRKNAKSGVRNLATSACGELAIATLLLMLGKSYEVKHLMYRNSGDVDDHDRSRVVGYHAFAVVRKDTAGFMLTAQEKTAERDCRSKHPRCARRKACLAFGGAACRQPSAGCEVWSLCVAPSAWTVAWLHRSFWRGCVFARDCGEDGPCCRFRRSALPACAP